MANTSPTLRPVTGVPPVDALTNGTSWALGPDRSVTWAVADAGSGDWAWSPSGYAVMRSAVASCLLQYSEVANIGFVSSGWFANITTAPADIVVSATLLPPIFGMGPTTYARAFFPNEAMSDGEIAARFGTASVYPNAAGDVVLNFTNAEIAFSTFLPGSNGYFALLHELGHALGMKHPHDNGGQPGRPTFDQIGMSPADTQRLTIMSYDPATSLAAWLQAFGLPASYGYPETLMPLDVVALHALYGQNLSTRATDTVYSLFNDNAIGTWWDAGGRDLVTADGSAYGWRIETIDVPGYAITLARPFDWTATTGKFYFNVEDFMGSQWPDQIAGNGQANLILGLAGNDLLQGNGGDDLIDGGLGLDLALYSGPRTRFNVQRSGEQWSVADQSGFEGKDSLRQTERIVFSDRSVALDVDSGGHARQAAEILRALFGPRAIEQPELVGIGIGLLDQGLAYEALVALAVDALQSLGVRNNREFVNVVYQNVVGQQPPPDALATFISLLDSRQLTQVDLAVIAARAPVNIESVEIVGLSLTGLDYEPFSG